MNEGTHPCVVIAPKGGWFFEAGSKNTPYIAIPLRVTAGECEGEEITYQGWLSDAAIDRTVANLADVFGWDGDLAALVSTVKDGFFVGKPCEIVTEFEEYEGKQRIKIKWLNAPGGGGHGGKKLDECSALALATRLAARAKMAAGSKPAPTPTPASPPPPRGLPKIADPDLVPDEEDDIPF